MQPINLYFHTGNLRTQRTYSGKKSYKCNQCDQCYYKSSCADVLRKHLKTNTGEKSNKCIQCSYKSSHVDNLRTYLKTHNSKKAKPMQLYFHTSNLRTQRIIQWKKCHTNAISAISVTTN